MNEYLGQRMDVYEYVFGEFLINYEWDDWHWSDNNTYKFAIKQLSTDI